MTDQSSQQPRDAMRERAQNLECDINEMLFRIRSLAWSASSLSLYMDYNSAADETRYNESIKDMAELIEETSDKAGKLTSDLLESYYELCSKLTKKDAEVAYLAKELSDVAGAQEDCRRAFG